MKTFKKYLYVAVDDIQDEEHLNYHIEYKVEVWAIRNIALEMCNLAYFMDDLHKFRMNYEYIVGFSDHEDNDMIENEINNEHFIDKLNPLVFGLPQYR